LGRELESIPENKAGGHLFEKTAFKRPEHERIAKGILRDRFDDDLFLQVHQYIDQERGPDHRRKHGHDRTAEEEILKRWNAEGVEHFKIHILADWVYDNLAQVVGEYYDRHKAGRFPLPYYDGEGGIPYCVAQKLREEPDPSKELARATVLGNQCRNCGSGENLTPSRFWAGMICKKCLEVRQIEVCLQCGGCFSSGLRRESTINKDKYFCPCCPEGE
jgi:hypothetical protein